MPKYNKLEIAQRFSRAAYTYDKASILQWEVGRDLLEQLPQCQGDKTPQLILDLGAGTGRLTQSLAVHFSNSTILGIDLATDMLHYAKKRNNMLNISWITADADQLPLRDNSCDIIFSNLMLQWSPHHQITFQEIQRVLKPDGLFLFSTLGPQTLFELRASWKKIDDYPHVHSFVTKKQLYEAGYSRCFSHFSLKTKQYSRFFNEAIDLMKELKMLGAANLEHKRYRGLFSKNKLQAVVHSYEVFRNNQGLLPASFEVYFGVATKV